jgi:uncharacterized protein (DUF697 family)
MIIPYNYEETARQELLLWQEKMVREPSFASQLTKGLQDKMNGWIPEKVHQVITTAIKGMVRGVLTGSEFISGTPLEGALLEEREKLVREKIRTYKKMGAASGAVTGAGGILLGLADFPVLLSLKMKMLFDITGLYGFSTGQFSERLYILHIFQLAFCSPEKRIETYGRVLRWDEQVTVLPEDIHQFDWRSFQQEYRDYMDIVKLLQLVPGIGAVIGAVANHRLVDKLGETAMQAYRLRLFGQRQLESGGG